MTMPAILPGVVPAPVTPTPNAHGAPTASGHEGGPTAAAFASVLTVMLGGHAAEATSTGPTTDASESAESGDGGFTAEATEGEHAIFVSPYHVMQGDAQIAETAMYHGTFESSEQPGEGLGSEPPAGLTGDALTLFYHPELAAAMSPIEAAADEAIGDPIAAVADAALAASLAIGVPQPSIMPDEKPVAESNGIHRGLGLVNAEFRGRLERVIERMESEFGYKVEIVETYRTQERQDALYAQGRTEAGPVVTWTRASNHTLGRAADLVIDGSYEDPVAYERLMQVAREEGLRTLGPRDPGHVELPAASSRAVIAQPAPSIASLTGIVPDAAELESPAAHNDAPPTAQRIAAQGVARVAAVAQVATVAQVAQVAMVGAQAAPVVHAASPRAKAADALTSSGPRRGADKASPVFNAVQAPSVRDLAIGNTAASTSESEGESKDGQPNDQRSRSTQAERASARETAADILRQTRDELMRAVTTQDPNASISSPSTARDANAVGHADMSERISRLLKVQEAANERPMSQMMLRLERPDGGEDRLRVDLRGNAVSATLDVTDQTAADRLGANVKELQRALERHGFETDSLTVRTMTRATDNSTLARVAGVSAETDLQRAAAANSGNSTNTSSRDRGTRSDEQRQSPDQQRQRSRKEQKGDR